MGISFDNILEFLNIKDRFNEKAEAAYTKAKENTDDNSIFDSKESFCEHYTEQIFGSSDIDSIPFDDFIKHARDEGFIDEEDAGLLQVAVDSNRDNKISHDEAKILIGAAYDSAQAVTQENKPDQTDKMIRTTMENRPELYEKVTVQPWGTGEDDCLSRIIQKHVDGVKLYTGDYNQFVEETCKLNNIKDPNIIGGDIKLPELKRNEDGTPLKDADGKLQFFSKEELENIKGETKPTEGTYQNFDGTYTRETKDADGNVIRVEFLNSNEEGAKPSTTIDYKYENGKQTGFERNDADGLKVVGTYDDEGRVLSEDITRTDGKKLYSEYEYNDDGTVKRNTAMAGGYKEEVQLDKEGREISGKVDFGTGEKREYSYTYNDDGTTEKTVKSNNGRESFLILDKNGQMQQRKITNKDGSIEESNYKDGKEVERIHIDADGNKTHAYISDDNIISFEKTNPDGGMIEKGKKDSMGKITDVINMDDDKISLRTYEDGSIIEWTDNGTKIGSVYVKDENGESKSLTGEDFAQWLNVDMSVKFQLMRWLDRQNKTPSNNEILEKSKEIEANQNYEYI